MYLLGDKGGARAHRRGCVDACTYYTLRAKRGKGSVNDWVTCPFVC